MKRAVTEVKCYRCGKRHWIGKCRWALEACFACRKAGHCMKECTEVKLVRCFRCKKLGYVARNCESQGDLCTVCGNCGRTIFP